MSLDDRAYDEVYAAAEQLLGESDGAEPVTSEQIAERTGRDRLEVEQALKHLFEQDRLTASFPTEAPATVTEVSGG